MNKNYQNDKKLIAIIIQYNKTILKPKNIKIFHLKFIYITNKNLNFENIIIGKSFNL